MISRKGAALSLEYVVKVLILTVVAVVIIGIITTFSSDIQLNIKKLFFEDEESKRVKTEAITSTFTTTQVKNYIKSCWRKTGEDYQEDVICYILKGDLSPVDKTSLRNVDDINVEVGNFNPDSGVATIKFIDIGNKVIVES